MLKNKEKYIIAGLLIFLGAAALIWIRSYLFDNIGASIDKRMQSLNLAGFNVRYDSLSINWLRNSIEIDNLLLEKNAYDTTCLHPEFIAIGKVRGDGVGLLKLIFQNVLSLENLYLNEPRIVMRQHSLLRLDSATQRENEFSLRIERVYIRGADFNYTDSIRCDIITALRSNLTLSELEMDFHPDQPFRYAIKEFTLDSVDIEMPAESYSLKILRAKMDLATNGFVADSIRVIPALGKLEFGRKYGFETDRYEATIPFLKARDLTFSIEDSTLVKATVAEIQFYLKVFRDKRLRFLKKKKLLPIAQLRDLPFDVQIDSLKIIKSYVQYEEYAEGATEPGIIFFDNLYGYLQNIDSRSRAGKTELRAEGNLLGHGNLQLFVTFPHEINKRSSLRGTIKNFRIPEINSMLTPTTQIKVESGNMKNLSFAFTFNSLRADGEIELNYEDLKLVTFKHDEKATGDEPEKDNLRTFIMNTFIFRKNMNEDVPQDKRTGTVMYLRDDERSIFNFWVKSLVSGIKSAYHLDKTEAKKTERELKKEERLSKREARRQKREQKKGE